MNEFDNVIENNNEAAEVETELSSETKEGIDFGGYAILGLAGVGGAFLIKKAYDLGKKGVEKAKAALASRKEKKAAAGATEEKHAENESNGDPAPAKEAEEE